MTNGGKTGVNTDGLRPGVPSSSGVALPLQRGLKKRVENVVNTAGLGPRVIFGSLLQRECNKQLMAGVKVSGIGSGVLVSSHIAWAPTASILMLTRLALGRVCWAASMWRGRPHKQGGGQHGQPWANRDMQQSWKYMAVLMVASIFL